MITTSQREISSVHTIGAISLAVLIALSLLSGNSRSWLSIALLYGFLTAAFASSDSFSRFYLMNSLFARFVLILSAHLSYLLFPIFHKDRASRFSKSGLSPALEHDNSKRGARPDWKFACKMVFNGRCVGTPMAAPSVSSLTESYDLRYYQEKCTKVDNSTPTDGERRHFKCISNQRRNFVICQSFVLLLRYLAVCLYYDPLVSDFTPDGISWNETDFSPAKTTLLRRMFGNVHERHSIDQREVFIRMQFVLARMIPDYLMLSSYHDILAIVAVCVGLDDWYEWPALFGDITQAYSVRRYWSHFWHHLIYRSFSAWAALTSSLMGCPKRYSRYVNNALVFVFSGFMHALVDWKLDDGRCGSWAVGNWFCLQIFAIIFEEIVQMIWRTTIRPHFGEQKVLMRCLLSAERTVGYMWVLLWFFWSVPKTYYPMMHCNMKG